jgi:hypothetical protein
MDATRRLEKVIQYTVDGLIGRKDEIGDSRIISLFGACLYTLVPDGDERLSTPAVIITATLVYAHGHNLDVLSAIFDLDENEKNVVKAMRVVYDAELNKKGLIELAMNYDACELTLIYIGNLAFRALEDEEQKHAALLHRLLILFEVSNMQHSPISVPMIADLVQNINTMSEKEIRSAVRNRVVELGGYY